MCDNAALDAALHSIEMKKICFDLEAGLHELTLATANIPLALQRIYRLYVVFDSLWKVDLVHFTHRAHMYIIKISSEQLVFNIRRTKVETLSKHNFTHTFASL